MTRIHARSLLALALLTATAAPAAAQAHSAQAEVLFRQGREQMEAGKIAEACASFESSEKAGPAASTLFSVGVCRQTNGQLATAWGAFVEVQRLARASSDETDQQFGELAAKNAAALEGKLSKLTIKVAQAVPGLEVRRGDEVVDAGAWNQTLPVDGGTYKVTARAPGHADWSTTVTIKPDSDAQAIEIPALAAVAIGSGGAGEPRSKKWPVVFGAGAVVLGGAAIGFELWAESFNTKIDASHDNAERLALWHSANWRRYTAEGLGVAAIAGAGTAVYLYVRHGKEEQAQVARGVQLVPVVSPGLAGLALDGHW